MATCDYLRRVLRLYKKCSSRMQYISLLVILLSCVSCVDRSNFKTCEQSSFCRRNRNMQPGHSPYVLQSSSVKIQPTRMEAEVLNEKNGISLRLEISAIYGDMLRLRLSETKPVRLRFEPREALVMEPEETSLKVESQNDESITLSFGPNKAVLTVSPFHVDVYSGDQLVISANHRGLLKFEHTRFKAAPSEGEGENEVEDPRDEPEDGGWEETFKSHTDSKPNGPTAVAMDFSFPGFDHVYGIPEHADRFTLKTTKGSTDPFRLYNLDVFEYELNNPMALYGSVPLMLAHSETNTVGILWLNAAETWVDIEQASKQSVVSSIVDFVKGNTHIPQKDTHWISESGNIDVFFHLGPGPKDVMKQYARLTGTTPLPPLFALAYHQSRWNYNDQEDVRNVDAAFDEHDIPLDVIWLDIEHTEGKKYFTWDKIRFPDPEIMITNLTVKGRKMVTIIDPHIKRESGFSIHSEATDNGYYVKNKDGNDFEGWCWPGSSSYLDFLSPKVREWWAEKFLVEQYKGSTLSLFTWNDMNEPSVFNGPEITMNKDAKHYGGWEHRDIHNIFGMLMIMSTFDGHLKRSNGELRPFVLSRAFFAGSQRFGAIWTGDNTADWGHLRATTPMLLSLSVAGISFCGADIGGFFKSVDSELLLRWYQAGAFQPFMRAHSHIDTKRREPWLFDEETRNTIRAALRKRYLYLPYWYTLFYENLNTGVPPMRPIWMEFPAEKDTFEIEDQYLIGNALLVHPVTDPGVSTVKVYFPGQNQVWYDIDTYEKFGSPLTTSIAAPLKKIPVYQRGGTIVPQRERIRRSSALTRDDPFTLIVALNKDRSANGTLYMDDGYTHQYKKGDYVYLSFSFQDSKLTAKLIGGTSKFKSKTWLERVVIVGLPSVPFSVELSSHGTSRTLQAIYDENSELLVVRKPGINVCDEWTLRLVY